MIFFIESLILLEGLFNSPGKPEIADFDGEALGVDEDVGGLEVAVDDVGGMQVLDAG